ncbi:MAG: translation initiation factor IF-2 [Elusimicrobia bacterium GWC2_65_9]|nr:MAG: translation initiation factor IF-2 [Elusimicrobia bacterium GWA2_66_18]OGR71027.1 MAG: translation initiation factor IF-2 [Elusimicrobia bacterium GWC2_65_9]
MNKKTTKKTAAKKPEEALEKPKKAVVKKAASSVKAKRSSKNSGKPEVEGVFKAEAEVRSKAEEGSIAPESSRLVSAFDLFKRRKVSTSTPSVTRLAAGACLPKPLVPPASSAPMAHAAPPPTPAAPAAAGVLPALVAKPPVPGTPALPPRAVPGQVQACPAVATSAPGSAAPAAAKPSVPGMPAPKPSQPGAKPGMAPVPQKPVILRPGAITTRPPTFVPPRPAPRPGQPGYRGGPHRQVTRPSAAHRPVPPAAPAVSKPVEGAKPVLKKIQVSSMITVRELSEKMEVKTNDVIKKLMSLGIFATINQRLETEAAQVVASDFGFELEVVAMYKEEELAVTKTEQEDPAKLKPRPPVVTIMGHVDHGKTSLLDAIRKTSVAADEAGGITQHIGAYKVKVGKGEVVFLDTPGHEAFTAMRARGAKVTDIVVLVVSATDGVMPQTVEAIDHAKAAGVPIVIAVNKIDLPGANPQKIRQDLSNHGLQPEEWGGKNIFVDVSAKKQLNLDKLLESLLLQSEILELKANPDRLAYGTVLEAKMDAKRGAVATVLIQAGTLHTGDSFVAGLAYGKIKALVDDHGLRIETAPPCTPVEVLGLTGNPQAGDAFTVVENEKAARDIAEKRRLIHREQTMAHQKHMTLVGLRSALNAGQSKAKDLHIVLKADSQGSLQALRDSLENLTTSECRVRIIHGAIGNASESDVLLASASDAVVLMFHADVEPRAEEVAVRDGVEIRKYEVIYDLIEDVKAALEGLLAPEIVDIVVGKGEVKQLFAIRSGMVAGAAVRDGKIARGGFIRVVRDGATVYEGKITTLKRFKDDVKEVEKGQECGIGIEGFDDFKVGDILEFYVKESRTRRLSQSPR